MKQALLAGFSAYLGFRPAPTTSLSELQLANAEALTDFEAWVELGYAKNCQSWKNEICVRTPYEVHYESAPFPYFP